MAIWAAAIAAGASLLANQQNRSAAADATNTNIEEAQKNRDFQEKMRATQYQTSVEDMKAAGINPMLAISNGGAGTPSGSQTAPAQKAEYKDVGTPAVNTYMASAQQAASLQNLAANTDTTTKQGDLAVAQAEREKATADQATASAQQLRAQTGVVPTQIAEMQQRIQESMQKIEEMKSNIGKQTQDVAESQQRVNESGQRVKESKQNVNESQSRQQVQQQQAQLIQAQTGLANTDTAYRNGQISQIEAQTKLTDIETLLSKLGLGRAANEAAFQDTWWGKKVSPMLPDLLKSSALATKGLK